MADSTDVDWSSLHARIARAGEASTRLLRPDDAETRRLLDGRARTMARPARELADPATLLALAYFRIGEEEMALETRFVRQVAPMPRLAPVPWTPSLFLGVTNHRGTILPVVDLAVLLSGKSSRAGELPSMLVLGENDLELAIGVSAVDDVVSLRPGELSEESAPAGLPRELVRGVVGQRRIVLRGEALLADPRLFLTRDG